VDDALIAVSVEDGKVELSGIVGSAAEKRRAKYDAWVGGVESVDTSGLEVRSWAKDEDLRKTKYADKTDEQIRKAVEWAAVYDPRVLSFHLEPDVSFGWVTMRGTVDNVKAKRAAGQLARNTVGVTGVSNLLKVRTPETLPTREDGEIATDIRHSLLTDPYTESFEITVKVKDGVATLTGMVDSYFERAQAEDAASRVRGVREVKNLVDVEGAKVYVEPEFFYPWYPPVVPVPSTPRPDHEVEMTIESELWWSPFVDADQVNVDVDAGVATLTGTVDTWREFYAAADNAYEGGATAVVNDLKVR